MPKHAKFLEARIVFRCAATLPSTVEAAAERRMMSASAYARDALLEKLRTDGFELFRPKLASARHD